MEDVIENGELMPNRKSFKNYLYFWSGQLFSLFGSMVVYFVIIWWVTVETQSPVYLALGSFFFYNLSSDLYANCGSSC